MDLFTIHISPFTRRESAATRRLLRFPEQSSGDHSAVAPPVPIPNTEVKRCSPDGSASLGCARVGRCQNLCPVLWKQGAGLFLSLSQSLLKLRRIRGKMMFCLEIHASLQVTLRHAGGHGVMN